MSVYLYSRSQAGILDSAKLAQVYSSWLSKGAGPADISGVASEQELDEYVDKRVTFTGTWKDDDRKGAGISNGHVFIYPDLALWGESRSKSIGASQTVAGYLKKVVVAPDADEKRPYPYKGHFRATITS
jgi:hypothetical protein